MRHIQKAKKYAIQKKPRHQLVVFCLVGFGLILGLYVVNLLVFRAAVTNAQVATANLSEQLSTYAENSGLNNSLTDNQDWLINYPRPLALFTAPLSSATRDTISQTYLKGEAILTALDNLVAATNAYTQSVGLPSKEMMVDNPEAFIESYDELVAQIEGIQNAATIERILIMIRDSAIDYQTTGNLEVFESRYDNVASELEKEIIAAQGSLLESVRNDITNYQTALERL